MISNQKIIDSRTFRDVMGRFTTGVTIVTVMENGVPHGMTVNSFTSVSLDPTLVLICLDKDSTTSNILNRSGRFTVNILTDKQENLARQFAESGNERDRFDGVEYTTSEEETPVLHNTLGNITCIVKNTVEGGDHLIFIGEVVDLEFTEEESKPLLYYRGKFKSLDVDGQIREKG
jgi:flavin reductase (DIM6/NTAB) family NADH-FMN oxidoreductase RutF